MSKLQRGNVFGREQIKHALISFSHLNIELHTPGNLRKVNIGFNSNKIRLTKEMGLCLPLAVN